MVAALAGVGAAQGGSAGEEVAMQIDLPTIDVSLVPRRLVKLVRRVMALATERRYIIVLTLRKESSDWTVIDAGKIEE